MKNILLSFFLIIPLLDFAGVNPVQQNPFTTNAVVPSSAIDAAGGVTNNAASLVLRGRFTGDLAGILKNNMIQVLYVVGDSLSVKLLTAPRPGWDSYGGRTNSSVSSAVTNQPDGAIYYNVGSYAANNTAYAVTLTNLLSVIKGYNVKLDTALAVPGAKMWEIYGGLASSNSDSTDQTFTGHTYDSSGNYSQASGIQGNWMDTWVPAANDYTFSYSNSAGVYITLTNVGNAPMTFIVGRTAGGYTTAYLTGLTNAPVTSVVNIPQFAGGANGSIYFPPWKNNGNYNNTTNNVWPTTWILSSNPPSITGLRTAVLLLAGGNDINNGQVISTNNVVPGIYQNQVNFLTKCKASNILTIQAVYPFNPNIYSGSVNQSNCWNTLIAAERGMPLTAADYIWDLAATNHLNNADTNLANYMDGTHGITAMTTAEGTNLYFGLNLNDLIPNLNPATAFGNGTLPANVLVPVGNLTGATVLTNNYSLPVTLKSNLTVSGHSTVTNSYGTVDVYADATGTWIEMTNSSHPESFISYLINPPDGSTTISMNTPSSGSGHNYLYMDGRLIIDGGYNDNTIINFYGTFNGSLFGLASQASTVILTLGTDANPVAGVDNSGNIYGFSFNGTQIQRNDQVAPNAVFNGADAAGLTNVSPATGLAGGTLAANVLVPAGNLTGSVSSLVNSNFLGCAGQTNIFVYTVPSSVTNTYQVGGYINVTAVTLDVVQAKVIFTDEKGTSQTVALMSSGVGAIQFSSMVTSQIRAKGGTTITLQATLTTGTGSITFDCGGNLDLKK
jgi:hypothetical protein